MFSEKNAFIYIYILKNTVNKYMADIRPDRLTTCRSEQKSVVSRRPSVYAWSLSLSLSLSLSPQQVSRS
jgi:hypothetical protein